jgi:hypothetical protein
MDYPHINYVMEREGLEKLCPYSIEKGQKDPENPHRHEVRDFTVKIKNDITDVIGNTPMVRINNITKNDDIKCEICKLINSLNFLSGKVRIFESRWFS